MIVTRRPYRANNHWNGLVNQLFNELENNVVAGNKTSAAAANIVETEEAYHLSLLAPGRNKELFAVKVENDVLTVSYAQPENKEEEKLNYVRQEFAIGNLSRSFTLDDKVDSENIQAKYEDGVLKLLLPKKPEVKPASRQISVG